MTHEPQNDETTPLDREAVFKLQRLSAWLLGLPDPWSIMFAQRDELTHALLQHLLADGHGTALRELHDGFDAAGEAADVAEVLAALNDSANHVARAIMAAWLLGRYLPSEAQYRDGDAHAYVMGPEAYRQSLVWHLIGATPMGIPQQGHQPWAEPPTVVT